LVKKDLTFIFRIIILVVLTVGLIMCLVLAEEITFSILKRELKGQEKKMSNSLLILLKIERKNEKKYTNLGELVIL
jgi:hypothetical protein